MLYKITLLNTKNKYFVADTFSRSFNLEGETHYEYSSMFSCTSIIYTRYTTIWKRSRLCFYNICCSSVLVCLTLFFSLPKNVRIKYSNPVAKLDRLTSIIQIRMKRKLWPALCCNKRGLLWKKSLMVNNKMFLVLPVVVLQTPEYIKPLQFHSHRECDDAETVTQGHGPFG
jgi:hypothetical protein